MRTFNLNVITRSGLNLLVLAALSGFIPTFTLAGDGTSLFGGDPTTFENPSRNDPRLKPMPWWTIPRRARVALRQMAAERGASVSRCLRIDDGDQITYEVHATRRTGFLQREDFVLTRVTESREAAQLRQEQHSPRGRLEHLSAMIQN